MQNHLVLLLSVIMDDLFLCELATYSPSFSKAKQSPIMMKRQQRMSISGKNFQILWRSWVGKRHRVYYVLLFAENSTFVHLTLSNISSIYQKKSWECCTKNIATIKSCFLGNTFAGLWDQSRNMTRNNKGVVFMRGGEMYFKK